MQRGAGSEKQWWK